MMKVAYAARELGLGQWLQSQQDFFSSGRMLDRYKRAFRFELQIESRVRMTSDGGGEFKARVISEKCPIEAKDYNESSEDSLQNLVLGQPKSLLSQYLVPQGQGGQD